MGRHVIEATVCVTYVEYLSSILFVSGVQSFLIRVINKESLLYILHLMQYVNGLVVS